MPTAESFTALGAGNGFPFCPWKVDVSSEGKWTTLSGWSKINTPVDDAAKAQSIANSLTQAMKLFWNLNGFTGTVREEDLSPPSPAVEETFTLYMESDDYEYTNWYKTAGGTDSDVNKEPSERVCYDAFQAGKLDPLGGGFDVIGLSVSIIRLYDGVTTNEDNFVGYGNNSIFGITKDAFDFFDLHSYYEADPYGITEYVEFSGAHYVANLEASRPSGSPDANYSIGVDASGNVVGNYSEGNPVTYRSTHTIGPLDFYTY